MNDGTINGLNHVDPHEMERFLNEWGMKILEPTLDEQAEIIAARMRMKEKAQIDPSHQQVP